MKGLIRHIFSILIMLLLCTNVHASYTPETVPHPRKTDARALVSNPDGILTADEQAAIQQVAQQLYENSGVEMVTVVLGDIGHADAFDFSVQLFNKWGIGRKGQNTGVLILCVKKSRKVRITTGGGVEGLLPDATCKEILDETIIPKLKKGHYGQGLLDGNIAIAERLSSQQSKEELLLGYKRKPVRERPWSWLSIFSLIIALIAWFLDAIEPRCPNCGKKGAKIEWSRIDVEPTYYTEGKRTYLNKCPYCGHEWKQTYSIPKKKRTGYTSAAAGSGGLLGSIGEFLSDSDGSFGGGGTFGGGAGGDF